MKPIYIKMSAFGSYAGEETVDFSDVNHGIFLITGDTGAGKTTIFDAITYALYDQTSGGKRDGEMMRSQFAGEDTRTFVELKFSYQGDIYTIIRSPRQERSSKRRNKDGEITKTVDAPSVELITPDGMPYRGKIKETNQKITQIIGLEVDQFTQIAMIAQGDFLKLLHAPSKDRKEIFTKIFNTRIYWRIEEELKNRSKLSYGRLEDNRKDIIREMENIRCIENSTLSEQWAETPRFLESDSELQIDLIRQMIEEAKEKESEILKLVLDNRNELSRVVLELQQAEGINQLFTGLEKEQNIREQLKLRSVEMNSVKSKLDAARKALMVEAKEKAYLDKQKEYDACRRRIDEVKEWMDHNQPVLEQLLRTSEEAELAYKTKGPELGTKISKINEFLPKFIEYEAKCKGFETLSKEQNTAYKSLEEILTEIRRTTDQQKFIQTEQQALKPVAEELITLLSTVEKLTERKASLESLSDVIRELVKLRSAYTQKELETKQAQRKAAEDAKNYENCYRQFIEGQAVILAHELREGCPCPVCGSTSHPMIAEVSETTITQIELEDAKKAKEAADQELLKQLDALHKELQGYESKKTLAEHEGRRWISPDFHAETTTEEDIQRALQECAYNLSTESRKKEQAIAAKKKLNRNEELLQSLLKELESSTRKKESADLALKEIEKNLAATERELNLLKSNLIYESSAAAREELSAAKEQMTTLEIAKENATKKYQALLEQMNNFRGKHNTEEESLARLAEERNTLKETFDHELMLQGFVTIDLYHTSLIPSGAMEALDTTLQEYNRAVIENENSLKHYMEQTTGKSKADTSSLETKKAELTQAGTKLEEANKQVYGIRSGNELILENVIKLFELRQKAKEEHTVINRLESTANGKVGPKRLNFQTYIQRRYFNSILREANKRLYIMSNGQFILKCRDVEDLSNQGEVGLDLDVYSMVNDQIRDVKTLSGGESFMAALAMALGMADIIQNCAGSIHIDTMFIDEGFGSLSDETRMQAINVLNELSEGKRLVGIISHVSELKAQIGTKLIVTKTDKGSKVRWDIGD
jgi:exonuclease SbcC